MAISAPALVASMWLTLRFISSNFVARLRRGRSGRGKASPGGEGQGKAWINLAARVRTGEAVGDVVSSGKVGRVLAMRGMDKFCGEGVAMHGAAWPDNAWLCKVWHGIL